MDELANSWSKPHLPKINSQLSWHAPRNAKASHLVSSSVRARMPGTNRNPLRSHRSQGQLGPPGPPTTRAGLTTSPQAIFRCLESEPPCPMASARCVRSQRGVAKSSKPLLSLAQQTSRPFRSRQATETAHATSEKPEQSFTDTGSHSLGDLARCSLRLLKGGPPEASHSGAQDAHCYKAESCKWHLKARPSTSRAP